MSGRSSSGWSITFQDCQECGRPFARRAVGNFALQKRCRPCRESPKTEQAICIRCCAPFVRKIGRNREKKDPKKFCGTACYWQSLHENGRPNLLKPRDRTCVCGKKFRNKPTNKQRFCSNVCRGQWQSSLPYDEWKGKLSANVANRPRGKRNFMFGKTVRHPKPVEYVCADGTIVQMRSTWEVGTARYLDARQIRWEYEPTRFDLGDCTYTPDFWLPDLGCYWEVKGWMHERSARRIRLFREQYPEIPLVVIGKTTYQNIADSNRVAEISHGP